MQKDQSRGSTSCRINQKYQCGTILSHEIEICDSCTMKEIQYGRECIRLRVARLTAHFPALWLEFQPPGNSREIVSGPFTTRLRKDTRTKSANFLNRSSKAALSDIVERSIIETDCRKPFTALGSESSLGIFLFWEKTEPKGTPDVLFRQCYQRKPSESISVLSIVERTTGLGYFTHNYQSLPRIRSIKT